MARGEQEMLRSGKYGESTTLSDTEKMLRDNFYKEDPPEIIVLYKKLAELGHKSGWIKDTTKYPLMYGLLYNAYDTALAVGWRFNNRDLQNKNIVRLAWCSYVGMADAYFYYKNWDDLRKIGLVYKLEAECGFDNIDDYIEKIFKIDNEELLRFHLLDVARLALDSNDGTALTAMFLYGIELGMQYLGLI